MTPSSAVEMHLKISNECFIWTEPVVLLVTGEKMTSNTPGDDLCECVSGGVECQHIYIFLCFFADSLHYSLCLLNSLTFEGLQKRFAHRFAHENFLSQETTSVMVFQQCV